MTQINCLARSLLIFVGLRGTQRSVDEKRCALGIKCYEYLYAQNDSAPLNGAAYHGE